MALQLLTNSRLKAGRACPRLHLYRYEMGITATSEAAALRFGSLIHSALEAWWLAAPEVRLEAALGALASAGETDPFDLVRTEEMIRGYHYRWKDEPYEVLAVEKEFRTPLVNPETGRASQTWELGGKIDAIVRDDRGRVLLVEHKTSSEDISPGSEYWRRLKIDGQISTYYEGARSLGFDVEGCLYDVLLKPTIRPLKATPVESRKYKKDGTLYANQREVDETPEEFRERLVESIASDPNRYFQRGEVVRLESEVSEALTDIWLTGQTLRDLQRSSKWSRNPDACSRYHRLCDFFDVCTGVATLDDETRFRRLDSAHPELTTLNASASAGGVEDRPF